MIIGNPYKFSIITKIVDEWNYDDSFCNGVLVLCIDGAMFPKEILTATLKSELPLLKECLKDIPVDSNIFNMTKEEAYKSLYSLRHPLDDDYEEDYRYEIAPMSLIDNNCKIFAVSDGNCIRVMADRLDYIVEESEYDLSNLDVKETYITINELNNILCELEIFINKEL